MWKRDSEEQRRRRAVSKMCGMNLLVCASCNDVRFETHLELHPPAADEPELKVVTRCLTCGTIFHARAIGESLQDIAAAAE